MGCMELLLLNTWSLRLIDHGGAVLLQYIKKNSLIVNTEINLDLMISKVDRCITCT